MKHVTVAALAVALAAGAGAPVFVSPTSAQDAGVLRQDGFLLPRDHQYEMYDVHAGNYTRVDVSTVPGRVQQGQHIYDRTAKAWVARPGMGTNPQYLAGGQAGPPWARQPDGLQSIAGRVQNVEPPALHLQADDGRLLTVDMGRVSPEVQQALRAGERVTVLGVPGPRDNEVRAQEIRTDGRDRWRAGPGRAPWRDRDVLARDGFALPRDHRFERYDGSTGQYVQVDAASVPGLVQRGQPIYDRTGQAWVFRPETGPNPAYLAGGQWGAPAGAAASAPPGQWGPGPPAGPQAPPGQATWQRLDGTVQSVQGPWLTLRGDDGRLIMVEMSQVSPQVRQALTRGERVTVTGLQQPGQQAVSARFIQQDGRQPAASPWTGR